MRIAYLTINWPRFQNSGVGQKMLTQMRVWQALGHDVAYFMHAHPHPQTEDLIPGTHVFYSDQPGLWGKIRREYSRSDALAKIIHEVQAFRPDVIYLRSGRYVYPLQRLFEVAPVVMEVNSNEAAERPLNSYFYGILHDLTDAIVKRRVSGMVSVSRQVAGLPELTRWMKPIRVIANGFDVQPVQPLLPPNNAAPRLVFIGSPGNTWHGVDKLVQFARHCEDVCIDVVGYDHLPGVGTLPGNLILHGYLPKADYLGVMAGADAAFGSLALHRIRVDEISPLKTRECLAYGLPMILPYRDTDLEDLQVDWLLSIPNREDNLITHAEAVREFAYRMRGQRADRSVVLERLDAGRKEAQRVEFFRQICEARI